MSNDKDRLGQYSNGKLANVLTIATIVLLIALTVVLLATL